MLLGAQVNARNARGQTPLAALTARRGPTTGDRTTTADLLRSLGAIE